MLQETSAGLYCEAGDFHIDPWAPVSRAVITHAHGDHARVGSKAYLCAAPSAPLLSRRFGAETRIESLPYRQPLTLGRTRISFHPAGHVLGSAQVRLEGPGGVWVVSGDYKRVPDPTCAPFEPVSCDTFVTESTFGLPIYRWDPAGVVIREIADWWTANASRGLASVLFCY
ncbi:MAG: ligase-associated DNA damage response exonuclease, partial [Vicinamibacterales bacterium]